MKIFTVRGAAGTSRILVGERLQNLSRYVSGKRPVIITDTNVANLYQNYFPPADVITIGTGEKIKTLDTVRTVYDRLVDIDADRFSLIIGIGGGIVCDLAGYVASTYMRGVRFGFVATTLLAQVDASVGGKNGVNFGGYKNLVGTFNQPEFVLCDMALLQTLPDSEIANGMAEIVKHGLIADAKMFAFLEENGQAALALDPTTISYLVYNSVTIKAAVVNRDETEQGERRKLNFGHTFGHAIEKVTGMGHGEAVSIGMAIASAVSVARSGLTADELNRIKRLLPELNLPIRFRADSADIIDALGKDKKRAGDSVHFVLLNRIGRAEVKTLPLKELKHILNEFSTSS